MIIEESKKGNRPHYHFIWESSDVDEYLSGCPDAGFMVIPVPSMHSKFLIFPRLTSGYENGFRPLDSDSYGLYLGIDTPNLPRNATDADFVKGDKLREESLERVLTKKDIPVQIVGHDNKWLDMYSISMSIDKSNN